VKELLNFPVVLEENEWGIDHGAWSVLKYMYPHADVPIVQLSLDGSRSARAHYELAKQLRPLRDENILILSSGNVVHNLRTIDWHDNAVPHPWAQEFNQFFVSEMHADHHESLIDWERYGDAAHLSIPTAEHYWPALYTLALQERGEHAKVFTNGIEMSSISMLGFSIQ
jgi:4,5-DOPA dioxygenase extradiol